MRIRANSWVAPIAFFMALLPWRTLKKGGQPAMQTVRRLLDMRERVPTNTALPVTR